MYFSFTGGPMLRELESRFGVRRAAPLYCSFDPERYRTYPRSLRFSCAMSYMGTYAPDRQPKLEEFLFGAAAALPQEQFIVAGPQYPRSVHLPRNVRHIVHLNPRWHPHLYSSSRLTLNVTRRDMVMAGYSPSVRLFEAAACGAAIVSDNWPGLDPFLEPGREILLPVTAGEIVHYLRDTSTPPPVPPQSPSSTWVPFLSYRRGRTRRAPTRAGQPAQVGGRPDLVGVVGAGPELELGSRPGAVAGVVEALAMDAERAVLGVGPVLRRSAVAGPELDLVAVGAAVAGVVKAQAVLVEPDRPGRPGAGPGLTVQVNVTEAVLSTSPSRVIVVL